VCLASQLYGKHKIGGLRSRVAGEKVRPYLKIKRAKRAVVMDQTLEYLPSKPVSPEFKSHYSHKKPLNLMY
jgi:hypothetical protein